MEWVNDDRGMEKSDLCPRVDDIGDESVHMTSTSEDFLAQIEFIATHGGKVNPTMI